MARDHLWQLGAAELSALVRAGKVSSREAVQSCLSRLEQVNPRLNAVVLPLAEAALAEAVEEIEPPGFTEAADLWQKLAMPDTIARLEPMVAANGDAGIKQSLGFWREIFPERDPGACLEALAERWRILRLWREFLERVPVVVTPVSKASPFPVGTDVRDRETTARLIQAQAPLLTVSVLGLPAISAPTGLHEGVPVGVQIIAGPCREDVCFDAAAVLEAHCPVATPIDPRGHES